MNKRMRELLAQIEQKQKDARTYMTGENKDVAKATTLLDEADKLKAEYETEKRLYEAEKAEVSEEAEDKAEKNKTGGVEKAFADAARAGFKDLSEGSNADGGYTVPEDIVTRIEKFRDAKASLRQLVRVVPVTGKAGRRTFKKRSTVTGFAKVLENGKFAKKNTPQFVPLVYSIDKYGGYFVLSSEVLEDSDANLVNEVVELIGDEARVTDNVEIIAEIVAAKPAPTNLTDLDGIKNALNVTLGQAFKSTSRIITNDNGLQYLDTLKDDNGRPLLSASPADPMQMFVAAGATKVPLTVLPNSDFPNINAVAIGDGIPFIIGDLNEGFVLWDRRQVTIVQSNVAKVGTDEDGYNAFEQGGLLMRADERADYTVRDAEAFVYGYIIPA